VTRIFTLVVATFFFVGGVLGLLQQPAVSGGALHDVFAVSAGHDALRIFVGLLGILAYSVGWSRAYCGLFGVLLLVIVVLGLVPGMTPEGSLLGLIEMNRALNLLYLAPGTGAR
jgi:spore maturation protein SpmA